MTWKVNYSASSREDLQSIYDYLAHELLSPENVAGQVERIMNAIRSLEKMSLRHQVNSDEPWKTKQVSIFLSISTSSFICQRMKPAL